MKGKKEKVGFSGFCGTDHSCKFHKGSLQSLASVLRNPINYIFRTEKIFKHKTLWCLQIGGLKPEGGWTPRGSWGKCKGQERASRSPARRASSQAH